MPFQEKPLDFLPVVAGPQFRIIQAALNIERGVAISVRLIVTDPTAKRLLVGPIGSIWIMAHAALLRGIGALDPDRGYASFGGIPGDLFGDVR